MRKRDLLLPVFFGLLSGGPTLLAADSASDWVSDSRQWAELEKEEVVLLDSASARGEGASHSATAAILVDAAPEAVWDVVADGDKAASFQDSLESSRVLERDSESIRVEQTVKIGFHRVSYIVRQDLHPPGLMEFSLESGDLREMGGFWRFFDVAEAGEPPRTLLVYRLSLQPDFPLPGFVIRKSIAKNLPDTLYSVRDEVESRAEGS